MMPTIRGGHARTLLALACASLVCETKQAFCPGWSGGALGPRAPLRARPRAQAGALSLECGFRDQLRKLNPFSQQSKSERLRRQWAERSNAVDVPGLEPSAPDASETKTPPSASTPANKSRLQDLLKPGTGTTKLQQELAAREAERMRAWSTPVPTKTAKLIFESAGGEESAEDRRKRQEAAAKDMERVLGRKLLQQRAQEAAQPELDEAERREIAARAADLQADMDRTLGVRKGEQEQYVSAIKRQPLPMQQKPGTTSVGRRPPAALSLSNLTKKPDAGQTDAPASQPPAPGVPKTVGEMLAQAAAEDAAEGLVLGRSAPPPAADGGPAQRKTFADETAEMTAGKTVGDVAKAGNFPKSAWALPKYVTKRVSNLDLSSQAQQKKGKQLGPKLYQSTTTAPVPKNLSLRELAAAAAAGERAEDSGGEVEQESPPTQEEDPKLAMMRSLARRRTVPAAPPPSSEPSPGVQERARREESETAAASSAGAPAAPTKTELVVRGAERTRWKVVNQKGVQLYTSPQQDCDKVGQLKGFVIVTADEERDGWVHVCTPMFGWVEVNDGSRANLMKMGKILQG